MARPSRTTVDYFPHYVHHGKTIYILQNLYGNDGYAFFYKLMELLGDSDGHFYDCRSEGAKEFLASITNVSWQNGSVILDKLSNIGVINKELWDLHIIWMQSFVDSIKDVYKKRHISAPEMPAMGMFSTQKPTHTEVSGVHNPQSKVKESKETPLPPLDDSPKKPEPPPKPSKPKRVKVLVDYDLEIQKAVEAFSPDMRTAVQAFVAVVASLNKTQKISQARELSLLGELSDVSATTTPDIFRYAILEATDRKKGNTGYIKAIIERKQADGVNGATRPIESAPPRAAPTIHYRENKDGSWTRVDPNGEERRITKADMDNERRSRIQPVNPVQRFVGALAGAM